MTIYWDENWMTEEHERPDILAEGDSWFSYWIPGNGNLINQIDLIWKGRYNILDIAYPGDEAIKMLEGNSYWVLQETLRQYDSIKLLLFSGGGNDIAAKNLLSLLQTDCSGAKSVQDCFRDGEPDLRLSKIEHAYRDLITLRDVYRPEAVIVTHNYDYAVLGKKLLWMAWLDPYFELTGVPRRLRTDIVAVFIDGLEMMFERLAATASGFEFVKTSGALVKSDWANELHPTAAGFRKIADRFRPVLLQYLQ